MSGALADQEREDSVKPRFTYIPGGLYTAGRAIFSRRFKFGWGLKKKKKERERVVDHQVMVKVKETEWRVSISPYRRSEIDSGVLELSKPDS